MKLTGTRTLFLVLVIVAPSGIVPMWAHRVLQQATSEAVSQSRHDKTVGTIKMINGNTITLSSDSGAEIGVTVDNSTRFVRVEPGQKDLKGASPIQLSNLESGDRVLVRGTTSQDGKRFAATGIIVMKRSDVEAKQEKERNAWRKNGIAGLVSSVEPASGVVTITTRTLAGKNDVRIQVSQATIIRRYRPDSVRFDDAKSSTLNEIKPGDQLRARGTPSADGNQLAADEIVSGAFRNLAGTVTAIDASTNTISLMDRISNKSVIVRVAAESELRKLPPEIAQRMALRLKTSPRVPPGAGERPPAEKPQLDKGQAGRAHVAEGTGGAQHNGDLQQILSRIPATSLRDLTTGDVVMIVSTEGTSSGMVTAITLLAGVEPILAASPKGNEGMTLSPWNLGGGGEDSNQ